MVAFISQYVLHLNSGKSTQVMHVGGRQESTEAGQRPLVRARTVHCGHRFWESLMIARCFSLLYYQFTVEGKFERLRCTIDKSQYFQRFYRVNKNLRPHHLWKVVTALKSRQGKW